MVSPTSRYALEKLALRTRQDTKHQPLLLCFCFPLLEQRSFCYSPGLGRIAAIDLYTDEYYSSNLLYPQEDRANNKLEFACRSCNYNEPASSECIYRNSLGTNAVGETSGMTKDVADDPTASALNPTPDFCTLCGNEIFCEICGQESDRGFWLEVEDQEMPDAFYSGLETPPLSIPSSTVSQQDFFDQQSAMVTESFESLQSQLPRVSQQPVPVDGIEGLNDNVDTSQKMKEMDMPV